MAETDKDAHADRVLTFPDLPGFDEKTRSAIYHYIESVIITEMQNLAKYTRMTEKNLMGALNSLQDTMEFNIKELNYKIGALKGQQEKSKKKIEEETMPIFSTLEEAEIYAEKQRADLLKKIGIKEGSL